MQEKKKKEKKYKDPTSNLSLPRPDRQLFTYSENKLLDQITTEIMGAWAKDLSLMKEHYKMIITASEGLTELVCGVHRKFPALESLVESGDFESMYEDILHENDRTQLMIDELSLKLFEIKKILLEKKKPFWKRIFQ